MNNLPDENLNDTQAYKAMTKEESDRVFETSLKAQGYTNQKEIDRIVADGATSDLVDIDLHQNNRETSVWIEYGIWEIQGLRKKSSWSKSQRW